MRGKDKVWVGHLTGPRVSEVVRVLDIGQGFRRDQAKMEGTQMQVLTESLRKLGVADEVISAAVAELRA